MPEKKSEHNILITGVGGMGAPYEELLQDLMRPQENTKSIIDRVTILDTLCTPGNDGYKNECQKVQEVIPKLATRTNVFIPLITPDQQTTEGARQVRIWMESRAEVESDEVDVVINPHSVQNPMQEAIIDAAPENARPTVIVSLHQMHQPAGFDSLNGKTWVLSDVTVVGEDDPGRIEEIRQQVIDKITGLIGNIPEYRGQEGQINLVNLTGGLTLSEDKKLNGTEAHDYIAAYLQASFHMLQVMYYEGLLDDDAIKAYEASFDNKVDPDFRKKVIEGTMDDLGEPKTKPAFSLSQEIIENNPFAKKLYQAIKPTDGQKLSLAKLQQSIQGFIQASKDIPKEFQCIATANVVKLFRVFASKEVSSSGQIFAELFGYNEKDSEAIKMTPAGVQGIWTLPLMLSNMKWKRDEAALKYSAKKDGDESAADIVGDPRTRELMKFIQQKCDLSLNSANVVDVACGNGNTATAMVQKGAKVTAVDKSKTQLDQLKGDNEKIITINAPGEDLPEIESESVDIVVFKYALHWMDDQKAIAEAKRILKPGGSIFIMTTTPLEGRPNLFCRGWNKMVNDMKNEGINFTNNPPLNPNPIHIIPALKEYMEQNGFSSAEEEMYDESTGKNSRQYVEFLWNIISEYLMHALAGDHKMNEEAIKEHLIQAMQKCVEQDGDDNNNREGGTTIERQVMIQFVKKS